MAFRGKSLPAGSATLAKLRKDLARGWPAGITVLTGDDLFHLDIAQRELLAALLPDADAEFALTVLDPHGSEKIDVGRVIAAVRSVGMFAPRRVVLLRELGALEGEPAGLVDYAKKPPPNTHLVVRAPEIDRRRKLHQALTKSAALLAFGRVEQPARLTREVEEIARAKQVTLEPDAARFLAAICGGDLYRVDSELDKIRSWLGEAAGETVSLADVREVAAGSGLLSGWEVADAVLQRDHAAALAALRRLIDGGEAPLQLLGGLAYRTRSMIQAKAMLEQGVEPRAAFRAANIWGIETDVITRGLARYSLDELLRIPSLLVAVDRDLKSRALAPGAVMEHFVDQLTG